MSGQVLLLQRKATPSFNVYMCMYRHHDAWYISNVIHRSVAKDLEPSSSLSSRYKKLSGQSLRRDFQCQVFYASYGGDVADRLQLPLDQDSRHTQRINLA